MGQLLYLFNPGNDMALANGDENYAPTRRVMQMTDDLALLPSWYAESGADILVPSLCHKKFAREEFKAIFPEVRFIVKNEIGDVGGVVPWGWSPMLVKQLGLLGIAPSILPSGESVECIRRLSHRSFSVSLLNELVHSASFCGSAGCLYSVQEVISFVEKNKVCLLKAPWSGSGKGLYWVNGYEDLLEKWSRKIIGKQNCVVGEPLYNKVEDFAMEFYSDGNGTVVFKGYSLFRTDIRGAYKGNMLASDEYMHDYLCKYTTGDMLYKLRSELEQMLSSAIGSSYRGYLGVDMMICCFEDAPVYRIHPCVEVNLRMNMGVVARMFCDRYMHPGSRGCFTVDYFTRNADLRKEHLIRRNDNPLQIRAGKICSGYLSLSLINSDTHYRVSVIVK